MTSKPEKNPNRNKWLLTISLALVAPLAPFFTILALNIRDPRQVAYDAVVDEILEVTSETKNILLLTVSGWPTQAEIVYDDSSVSESTPIGYEFRAETNVKDIDSLLQERGISVETKDISEVKSLETVSSFDVVGIVYPVRHQDLPWQLVQFFDEQIEPMVARRDAPLPDTRVAGFALGDSEADRDKAIQRFKELTERYDVSLQVSDGMANTTDFIKLYRETADFAKSITQNEPKI